MLVSLKFSRFCTRVFHDPHYMCLQETAMQASYQDLIKCGNTQKPYNIDWCIATPIPIHCRCLCIALVTDEHQTKE